MASRNVDRLSVRDWRPRVETVAAMRRERWEVVAKCPRCALTMKVDLARVARERGPQASLWDRDAPCRRAGCAGRMVFMAKGPGMAFFETLTGHVVEKPPAWRRGRD